MHSTLYFAATSHGVLAATGPIADSHDHFCYASAGGKAANVSWIERDHEAVPLLIK